MIQRKLLVLILKENQSVPLVFDTFRRRVWFKDVSLVCNNGKFRCMLVTSEIRLSPLKAYVSADG